jgi:hypothetical protein
MTARDRIMIIVVIVVAAVAGSWVLVIQPKRDQASQLATKLSSVQSQLVTARQQVAASEAARGAFTRSYAVLAKLGEAVPADDDVPSLVYQLQAAAGSAHVDFRGLTLNGSGSLSASSASTSSTSTAALPPGVTVGPAGFPVEPFTFTFQGTYSQLESFIGRLQRFVIAGPSSVSVSGRLMTLNAINLAAAPQGFPQITATISATTYVLPASQGVTNGATPAGPAAGSSSSSGTATASTSTPPAAAPAVATPRIR